VVEEKSVPAVSPAPEAAATAAPAAETAPDGAAPAANFVDPEFGMLPPPAESTTPIPAATAEAAAGGFKPKVEFGGEVRTRYAQDFVNDYALIRGKQGEPPKARGMEDVIDWRSSLNFWSRIKMTEQIQSFVEIYAEYDLLAKRNESDPTVIFNGRDYRSVFKFDLREAYFDIFLGDFDLRVGNQIVSWGTLAVMSPSDRINPKDPSNFYWSDIGGARKPVPALKGAYHFSDMSIEVVWVPFFTPPPLDIYGGDYSIFRYGSAYASTSYPLPDINAFLSDSKTAANHSELLTTRSPDPNPVNSQIGLRFSGTASGVDFGLSYYFGYEEIPVTRLDPELWALAKSLAANEENRATGYLQDIMNRVKAGTSLADLVDSRYERKHSLAGELGFKVWEIGLKAEWAFNFDKTYYTRDLLPVSHHTFAYAAGLDVMKTDLGALSTLYIDLELFGSVLFDSEDGGKPVAIPSEQRLMFATDKNLGLFTTLRLAFLDNDLEIELVTQTNFSTKDYAIIPKLSYSPITDLRLTVGVMLLEAWAEEPKGYNRYSSNADSKSSMFGQFSDNDQLFVNLKYSF